MATPRKAWFRVPDSIWEEGFSNDEIAFLVRLQAVMNTRWARNGLTAEEAGVCRLTRAQLLEVSGRGRGDVARKLADRCADLVSLRVEYDGDFTVIYWPKWPVFQQLDSRFRGKDDPGTASVDTTTPPPPPPPPHDAPEGMSSGSDAGASGEHSEGQGGRSEKPPSPERQAELAAAEQLVDEFVAGRRRQNPNTRAPAAKARRTWVREADRMLRLDPADRTLDGACERIAWLFGPPEGATGPPRGRNAEFWSGAIQSVPKLREHWDRLTTAMEHDAQQGASHDRSHKPGPIRAAGDRILERIDEQERRSARAGAAAPEAARLLPGAR